jgi:ABC-type antimicrobial peptide transport system permease subunit
VLTDAVWTGAAATAIGVVAALFLGQSVAGFVLGTTAHDPLSLTAAALVTFGTGVVGAVLAADGAARISPIDALRD